MSKSKQIELSELGSSTFRHDGYKDAALGFPPSPPGHFVFDAEYNEGYSFGLAELQMIEQRK